MKLLINYATKEFRKSQKINTKTGIKVGEFDKVIQYSPKDIDSVFYKKNKKILSLKRGVGYWLWKPYFIKKSLKLLNEGDYLFYCDSGAYFLDSIDPLIELSKRFNQDIIAFENAFIEREWSKRDAFILMGCDMPKYGDTNGRLAGFILLKKSKFTTDFVNEWLKYSQDERIITDLGNQLGKPNYPGFKENRHDQTIFSLLTKKYNLKHFRDPSQRGNSRKELYPESNYKQLIQLTRAKNYSLLERVHLLFCKLFAKLKN